MWKTSLPTFGPGVEVVDEGVVEGAGVGAGVGEGVVDLVSCSRSMNP
jgi:hypothetical protein